MAQSEARRKDRDKWRKNNVTRYNKYQKEKFKTVAAVFKRQLGEELTAIYKAHGVSITEILKAAAQCLTDETTTAEQIKQVAQMWTDNHATTAEQIQKENKEPNEEEPQQ